MAGDEICCGEMLAECSSIFDSTRFDEKGRLWTTANVGIHRHATDGRLTGTILVPARLNLQRTLKWIPRINNAMARNHKPYTLDVGIETASGIGAVPPPVASNSKP